ncbi:hypothetical protein HHI36_001630 [Cryptolaemus montrouzieri]|uniref:Tyr recombinase domain-containing protein n=1 Tax=Cryptolaemus montrouzieri TaxID=559131 RepID=A0ABD2P8Y9_9CUCU
MDNNEMEQIAKFMGHIQKTHAIGSLPQDIYQTAKVAKILILLAEGKGHQIKGKSLDEIELDEELTSDSDDEESNTTEKMLAKKFKRIITEEKGSKHVAILFPPYIQTYVEELIIARRHCVSDTNEYLFANPNTQNRWLSGYHSVKKLAQESGIENPSLFTSTRFTILQVIDMTQDELEQFANFMGHTRKTHVTYYRLPQDIYQTAKVSKLLLAINSGKGSFFNKINLDDIDITDIECSNSEEEEYGGKIHDAHKVIDETKEQKEVKKNIITRLRWGEKQKN